MQIDAEGAGRLAKLAAEVALASAKAAEAQAAVDKAERGRDRADDHLATLREEYDRERLRLWGSTPDVTALLAPGGSTTFYEAAQALAEAYGLGFGMLWADTKQLVLHVRLNRGEAGAVERAEAGVRFFAPHVKPKGGWKRFGVQHREAGEFAVELRYSQARGTARVVRMHFGQEDSQLGFKSLAEALRHIQATHWVDDIYELGPGMALLESSEERDSAVER